MNLTITMWTTMYWNLRNLSMIRYFWFTSLCKPHLTHWYMASKLKVSRMWGSISGLLLFSFTLIRIVIRKLRKHSKWFKVLLICRCRREISWTRHTAMVHKKVKPISTTSNGLMTTRVRWTKTRECITHLLLSTLNGLSSNTMPRLRMLSSMVAVKTNMAQTAMLDPPTPTSTNRNIKLIEYIN